MAQEAFIKIKEAESRAQTIIDNAQDEADQIVKRAGDEAADAFMRYSELFKQQAQNAKQEAEQKARRSCDKYAVETAELCAALREKLLSQKAKAVDAVVQYVTA